MKVQMHKSEPHIFVIREKTLQYLAGLWSASMLCLTACCGERAQFSVEASLRSLLCARWLGETRDYSCWFVQCSEVDFPWYHHIQHVMGLRLDCFRTHSLCAHLVQLHVFVI